MRKNIISKNPLTIEALQKAIKDKLSRLEKIDREINRLRVLFNERDRLIEELLPLFVNRNPDGSITILREVRIGNKVYHIVPSFLDNKKNKFIATQWKSVAFQNFYIEQ